MALDPTLPVVAAGELITADHMNDIRANLMRLDTELILRKEALTVCLTSATSTGADGAWTDWLTCGDATVPTGTAYIMATVQGGTLTDSNPSNHSLRLLIGSQTATTAADAVVSYAANVRQHFGLSARFDSFGGAGTRSVKVQTNRFAGGGSGRLTFDYPVSGVTVLLRYYGT